jgi:hypothetical protein
MRVVQAACWCSAIVIAITTIVVLYFEFGQRHAHALPSSVSIDDVFGSWGPDMTMIVPDLPHDERVILAKLCASGVDLALLSEIASASPDASIRSGVAIDSFATVLCKNVDSVREMARQFAKDDLRNANRTLVQQTMRHLVELGYGENPTDAIRDIIAAAVDGIASFERHEFVDLGCGRSKVLAVACTQLSDSSSDRFLFEKCHGVEYIPARVAIARQTQQRFLQAIRDASDEKLADRLADAIDITQGDARSVELASRLFPRVSVVYAYNTLFGPDLDGSIARLLVRYARRGTRIMLHKYHASMWPSTHFRLVQSFAENEISWTGMFLLEMI